ncbi:putative glycosyltransferase [Geobacter sp. OR-1]|uniref:glycosyltransferase family 4 protein n=1 Tax=Geobacter sp. OR-1 TaxID=1266765 RepID=UPI000542E2D0|nr:glycosyltransferase family 4 protein [Geobacter sp. OR-1]GAM08233.1 putative glycosyltransferase [Geobacter sp. OR-1]
MKVAIIHYWLVTMRGGEKVVEALCELFPQAVIYTHVYDPESVSPTIRQHKVVTTYIQKLPNARKKYQSYLPLMPLALEQLDLREYDLVISSESGPAKGVLTRPDAVHICYCHTPMRYVWDMYFDYRAKAGMVTKLFMLPLIHYLKMWDYVSAGRVDHFIANSHFVARRIEKHYRRRADVIHPPVTTSDFSVAPEHEDYYLALGQLVGYKRFDLAVEAFNALGKRLVIIGEGEALADVKRLARGNVQVLGRQPFAVIKEHLRKCRALIFPGIEDFGIVPVEAMACGKPVISFKAGGALETVLDGVTGLFFEEQTVNSLVAAVRRFESVSGSFDSHRIAEHARNFDREIFKEKISGYILQKMREGK